MRFANSPSRTWIFATARDIWVVFLLIRGTSGAYVLSVSVLTIIGKMQKFPIIDFPYKYIKRLVFHFFYLGLYAHTRAKFKGVCKDFLIKLFLSHNVENSTEDSVLLSKIPAIHE